MVEEACATLGYTVYQNHFVKEADILKQQQESFIAKVMMKHGLPVQETNNRETPEQVRAAIKELFPRIPQIDLDEIVKHAWEEGSHRVGTNQFLNLPRRVQLATIARIRHKYTDYDRLLRAFDWGDARKEVEPECLKKLVEWRGENDEVDDNELEEIVRETIVIDDDDDGGLPGHGHEADDEDSSPGHDAGHASDTSVEISHRPAVPEDLRAEDPRERENKYLQLYQPLRRTLAERNDIARAMIGATRGQLREKPAQPAYGYRILPPAEQSIERPGVRITHVPTDARGEAPRSIIVDGMVLRRVSDVGVSGAGDDTNLLTWSQASPDRSSLSSVTLRYPPSTYSPLPTTMLPPQQHPGQANSLGARWNEPTDRAVPSIERNDARAIEALPLPVSPHRPLVPSSRPIPAGDIRAEKRRRVDEPIAYSQQRSPPQAPYRQHDGPVVYAQLRSDGIEVNSPRYIGSERYVARPDVVRVVSANHEDGLRRPLAEQLAGNDNTSGEPPGGRFAYLQEVDGRYRRVSEPMTQYEKCPPADNGHIRGLRPIPAAPRYDGQSLATMGQSSQAPREPNHLVARDYYNAAPAAAQYADPGLRQSAPQHPYSAAYPQIPSQQPSRPPAQLHLQPQRRSRYAAVPAPIHGAPAPVQQALVKTMQSVAPPQRPQQVEQYTGYPENEAPTTPPNYPAVNLQYQQFYYPR